MSLSQLQQTMATLRLSLAEIKNKEQQIESMISQFRTQLRHLPRQVIYGKTTLDASISAMGEIEERLGDSLAVQRRLLAIKKATQDELTALESVKQVDEARSALDNLKQQILDYVEKPDTLTEIKRVEQFIAQHSKMAELAITESYQSRSEMTQEGNQSSR